MVKNKKGWIKIIEVFMSILLLMSLLFIIFSNNKPDENFRSILEREQANSLKAIEMNQTLRNDILNASTLPVTSNLYSFPNVLRNYTKEEFRNDNCIFKLCLGEEECVLDSTVSQEFKGDIYLKSVIVHSNKTLYSPKKLSMICSTGDPLSDYFPACDDGLMNGDEFGVDCNIDPPGGNCPLCGECTGTLKFECEKLKQESACRDRGYCNWTGSECERVECHEIVDVADCISGQGCYAIE